MQGAGALRHSVRIDAPAMVSDNAGGEVTAWTTVATVPAEVLPTGGGKDLEGTVISVGQQRYRVRLRYIAAFQVEWRLVWLRTDGDAVPMRIDSIADPDGRRRWLTAYTTAGVPT